MAEVCAFVHPETLSEGQVIQIGFTVQSSVDSIIIQGLNQMVDKRLNANQHSSF